MRGSEQVTVLGHPQPPLPAHVRNQTDLLITGNGRLAAHQRPAGRCAPGAAHCHEITAGCYPKGPGYRERAKVADHSTVIEVDVDGAPGNALNQPNSAEDLPARRRGWSRS